MVRDVGSQEIYALGFAASVGVSRFDKDADILKEAKAEYATLQ
jgi:hypothetical protein